MGNIGAHFTDADRQSLIVASSCIRLRMSHDPVFMALAILIDQALAVEQASGAFARNAEQVRPKFAEPYDPVLHCINSPEWKAAERKIREESQDVTEGEK